MKISSVPSWLKNRIIQHYSDIQYDRSEAQLEREKWLIPKVIPFNRYMLMPCAALSQACVGTFYAWSGFNLPIEARLYGRNGGVDRAVAANVFYVAIAFFSCSAAVAGPWLERNGPRKVLLMGASLFFFGNLLTALGVYVKQLPVIYFGYGVFGATGLGMSYVCPTSLLQKWFPERRGVAASAAVCGYSVGAIIAPFAQKGLIGPLYHKTGETNLGIELTFLILGSSYFVIMTTCAFILRQPPPGYSVQGPIRTIPPDKTIQPAYTLSRTLTSSSSTSSISPILDSETENEHRNDQHGPTDAGANFYERFEMTSVEALSSLQYWIFYLTFMGAEMSSILIYSKIQSMVQTQLGRSPNDGATANAVLGGCDLLGRLLLPVASDWIKGYKPLYALSLACQLISLSCLPTVLESKSFGGLLACGGIIVFFYGGGFGMLAAFLSQQFGARNVGPTNGVAVSVLAVIGIMGGLTFTAVYRSQQAVYPDNPTHWYDLNFRWMLGPVSLALMICLLMPTDLRVLHLPRIQGEFLRFRLPNGKMIRATRWKVAVLSAREENEEWTAYLQSRSPIPKPAAHLTI